MAVKAVRVKVVAEDELSLLPAQVGLRDWTGDRFIFCFFVLLCCLFFCCILLEERVKVVTEDDLSLLTTQAPLIRLVVHSLFVLSFLLFQEWFWCRSRSKNDVR